MDHPHTEILQQKFRNQAVGAPRDQMRADFTYVEVCRRLITAGSASYFTTSSQISFGLFPLFSFAELLPSQKDPSWTSLDKLC